MYLSFSSAEALGCIHSQHGCRASVQLPPSLPHWPALTLFWPEYANVITLQHCMLKKKNTFWIELRRLIFRQGDTQPSHKLYMYRLCTVTFITSGCLHETIFNSCSLARWETNLVLTPILLGELKSAFYSIWVPCVSGQPGYLSPLPISPITLVKQTGLWRSRVLRLSRDSGSKDPQWSFHSFIHACMHSFVRFRYHLISLMVVGNVNVNVSSFIDVILCFTINESMIHFHESSLSLPLLAVSWADYQEK